MTVLDMAPRNAGSPVGVGVEIPAWRASLDFTPAG